MTAFDYKLLSEFSSVFNVFIFMTRSLSLITDKMSPNFEISNTLYYLEVQAGFALQ